jgi:hypothetical protein
MTPFVLLETGLHPYSNYTNIPDKNRDRRLRLSYWRQGYTLTPITQTFPIKIGTGDSVCVIGDGLHPHSNYTNIPDKNRDRRLRLSNWSAGYTRTPITQTSSTCSTSPFQFENVSLMFRYCSAIVKLDIESTYSRIFFTINFLPLVPPN